MLILGNMGSGKTTWLINKYKELISKGVKTSEIIVICQNSHLKNKFVEALKKAGIYGQSYPIYTFNGLAYRSILNNWPVFEDILPESFGQSVVSPDMTGVNVTSYVLKKNVERVGFDDYLSGQNLMYQLLRRYALISHNALSQEEIDSKSELLNETFANDAKKVINQTKSDMLKYRTFDYLRQIEAFVNLFSQGKINDFDGVKYLLVDDFDEMTYQGFSFVKTLSARMDEYFIAFDRHGGARRGYLCAYADGWREFEDEILELPSISCDAEILYKNFTDKVKSPLTSFEFVSSEQNISMVDEILSKISDLLEQGAEPCDIRLVAPELETSLRHSLEIYFVQNEISYQFLSGTKRLYEDKFVFASLVILLLVHPEWGLRVQESEIRRLLSEFLALPIILCQDVLAHFKKHSQMPLSADFGDDTAYSDLIFLIEDLKLKKSSISDELMYVFKSFVLPKATENDTFSYFNQLFSSLDDFEALYSKMNADIPYQDWALQVKGSIVSDNPAENFEIKEDALIISTPQKIIDLELSSKYQFWIDAKNPQWLKDDTGRLYNSWVFQHGFECEEYSQKLHSELTLKKSAHLLRKLNLLCEKTFVFASEFGVSGSENQGELLKYLCPHTMPASSNPIKPREDQKPVLGYSKGKMAVPAVPGAGKTTIMQALIMKLIEDGVVPSQILVLTYMDSAAKNFSERIKNNFPDLDEYPYISTIHGLARRIIADGDNANRVGLEPDFDVCDETRYSMITSKVCLDNLPSGEDFKEWLKYCQVNISKAKMLLLSPFDIETSARKNPDSQLVEFAKVYRDYDKALKRSNLVDYDDLLILAHTLLEKSPDVRAYYQNKFSYVIEDEAQDSSPIQQKLIEFIAQKSGNIVRCGDVNQAIMSTFTNADVEGFSNFINTSDKVEMTSSQRCAKDIYELANSLVDWAQKEPLYKEAFYNISMQPVLGSNPQVDECVSFASFDSDLEEIEYVTAQIKQLKSQNPDASIAILLRNNYQMGPWINALEKNGLEVLCRADELKEKRVFKLTLAMLKFINSPFDNSALASLAVAFNHSNLMRISNIAIDFLKKLKDPILKNEQLLYSSKELDSTDFVAFWWDAFYFLNKSATMSLQDFLLDLGKYYFDRPQDLSNVSLIAAMIRRFETSYLRDTQKEPTLKDIVTYLDQVGRSRGVKYFDDGDVNISAVEIMTIHKSKGDEFDAVFIPQFVDKYHKINPEKIELRRDDTLSIKLEKLSGTKIKTPEQKKNESAYEALRLIYVAITRAKSRLYFTSGSSKDSGEIFALLKRLYGGVKV